MNPRRDVADGHLAYKDAVFLSPHKFVGGPGHARRARRQARALREPRADGARRRHDPVRQPDAASPTTRSPAIREEGGTPAIVESIRAGLVFALKEAVGAEEIRRREDDFARRALASWSAQPAASRSSATPSSTALAIVVARPAARGAGCCTRTSSSRCSTTSSASRRAAAASAPARTSTACYPIDDELVRAHGRRGRARPRWAPSSRFVRLELQLLHQRDRLRVHPRGRPPRRRRRAGSCCPLYSFDPRLGPLAARRRPRPGAAVARRRPGARPRLTRPRPRARFPATWRRAREVIAGVEAHPPTAPPMPALTPDFERIRWFPLPGEASRLQTAT